LFAPAVFFDDKKTRGFGPLVCGEAVLAGKTFASPPDDALVVARIDDARVALTAGGTDQVAAPA
jgi:hypothetical protein